MDASTEQLLKRPKKAARTLCRRGLMKPMKLAFSSADIGKDPLEIFSPRPNKTAFAQFKAEQLTKEELATVSEAGFSEAGFFEAGFSEPPAQQ